MENSWYCCVGSGSNQTSCVIQLSIPSAIKSCCKSKKSWSALYSNLIYKMGQEFLTIQQVSQPSKPVHHTLLFDIYIPWFRHIHSLSIKQKVHLNTKKLFFFYRKIEGKKTTSIAIITNNNLSPGTSISQHEKMLWL